jgi:hypothetical protein
MKSLWATLNNLYISTTVAHDDVIVNRYTISVAFNNWQQMIKKVWQTSGSLSTFLKGVAAFAKKDKAVLLPVGSVLTAPSGMLFCVISSNYLDAYSIVIHGEMVNPGDVNGEQDGVIAADEDAVVASEQQGDEDGVVAREQQLVLAGALVWPVIGWNVHLLFGIELPANLSYVDPIIPPQMNACVHRDLSDNNLLFSQQVFYSSGEQDLQYLTSVEYNRLIVDSEDIILLNTFVRSLDILHHWMDELEIQREEEPDFVDGNQLPYPPVGVPHNYGNEKTFLDQIRQCSNEIHHATTFQGDMICYLYPHSRMQDHYIHFPIIGRDKISKE